MLKVFLIRNIPLILLVTIGEVSAQVSSQSFSHGDRYSADRSFFQLPAGKAIGSAPSIEYSPSSNSLWVVDRCGANNCVGSSQHPVLEFDLAGRFLQSFGGNLFVRPHGLHVDKEGYVWVTDGEGPNGEDPRREGKGHQVFKFSPTGELAMTLGTAGIAGSGEYEFNQPSDVVTAPNGDIFVADGHGGNSNARIMKFDSKGAFLKSWGQSGSGNGDFAAPHTLAMDSLGRIFVGDRGNNLVQIFTQEGVFLEQWIDFGEPSGIHIDSNDIIYVTDSTNREIANRGIRIADLMNGEITNFIPDSDQTASQEGVTSDQSGNIYGSSTRSRSLQKYSIIEN